MITADNVSVIYTRGLFRKLRALDGFTLHVNPGDVVGLLGPNGAGKSTAMYCFLGLIKPNVGAVTVFGKIPKPGAPLYNRIAYVPEEPHYHLYMTVDEAMRFYSSLYTDEVSTAHITTALEKVGLIEYRDLKLEKCSKGMKQKLGIALCLVRQVDLVFLDEPTRGLDPVIVKEFRDIIIAMNRQGTTFIINSHILSEVEMVCNRVAIMNHGRVIVQDELRNLLKYDIENYSVEVSDPGDIPPFIINAEKQFGQIRGTVKAQDIGLFFRFVQDHNLKICECSLKRLSLEEAFFSVLKEDPHAQAVKS